MVNALEATADGEMTVVVLAPLSDEVLPPDAVDAPPPPVALVVAAAEEEAWDCVCVCVCWPLPSNQSFYRQIAGYQRGVDDHGVD